MHNLNNVDKIEAYKSISIMSKEVDRLVKAWKMPKEYLQRRVYGSYNHNRYSENMDVVNKYQESFTHPIGAVLAATTRYISSLVDKIHDIRGEFKKLDNISNGNSIVERAWKRSKNSAEITLRETFSSRSLYSFNVEKNINNESPINKEENKKSASRYRYYSSIDIKIPRFWYNMVYNKGVPIIHGSKGALFTIKAKKLKEENIPKIEYDMPDCTIFKVETMGVRKRMPYLQSGYLLINDYEEPIIGEDSIFNGRNNSLIYDHTYLKDNKIHAFNPNLKKAAILLNRRIKQEILSNI